MGSPRRSAAAEAVALCLATPAGPCLAWYHEAAGGSPAMAVLLCGPIGHEAVLAYPTLLQIARALADAGLAVLRFDWPGSGDSCGDDGDPGRLAAWRACVDAAAAELRHLSTAPALGLFGIRLGGTLACEASVRLGGVDALALWAAPARGREFVRELRLAGRQRSDGGWSVAGTPYTRETLDDLNALLAVSGDGRPAPRALVLQRDDLVRTDPLPERLRQAGCAVDECVLPGFAGLLRGAATGALAVPALETLGEWFLASIPPPAARARRDRKPFRPVQPASWSTAGVQETLVRFGSASLCGVLSRPDTAALSETGVVIVSVGNNHRVGPHRLNVAMARALAADGCRTLRFDLAGFGDSVAAAPGGPKLYDPASARDVQAAIDVLVQEGCRDVVVAGVCSGAYLAFQAALRDARVAGLVLINARLLRWTERRSGDGWECARELNVRTLRSYRESLSRRVTWQRLLRGEFGAGWIVERIDALAVERWRQLAALFTGKGPTVAGQARALCEAGTRVLVLVGDTDDARGYVEYQFGRGGSRLRGCRNFAMRDVLGDHNFNGPGEMDALLAQLRAFVAEGGARQALVMTAQASRGPELPVGWVL